MARRGSVAFFLGAGILAAGGCGGRTLGDEYEEPGSGLGASSGRGGATGRGGKATGGSVTPTGGAIAYGGFDGGGAGPYPGGGYPYPYPAGGFGGTFPVGGSIGVGGAFPAGGYGGAYPGDCCEAHGLPLCQPSPVAQCVCATLPHCCTNSWDERCVALIEPLGCGKCGKPPETCQSCLFSRCFGELTQCFQDFGCLEIFSCVQATGCNTFECYRPETCAAVIDQYGGPGSSAMSILLKAATCTLQSGCPCN